MILHSHYQATFTITASDAVHNEKLIESTGSLTLTSLTLSNSGNINALGLTDTTLTTTAGNFDNRRGNLSSNGLQLHLNIAGKLDNTGGSITHTGIGDLNLMTQGAFNNFQGSLTSNGNIGFNDFGHRFAFYNQQGTVSSNSLSILCHKPG